MRRRKPFSTCATFGGFDLKLQRLTLFLARDIGEADLQCDTVNWLRTFTLLTTPDHQSRRLLLNDLQGRWREPF
jgi:hypothetical protein